MEKVEYVYFLSVEQIDRLRVRFYKDKGTILQFVVQYEMLLRNQWQAVVRYDTSHGFAHRDLMHPDGSVDKLPLPTLSYTVALTYATQDLKQNWHWYRQRYYEENGKIQ